MNIAEYDKKHRRLLWKINKLDQLIYCFPNDPEKHTELRNRLLRELTILEETQNKHNNPIIHIEKNKIQ